MQIFVGGQNELTLVTLVQNRVNFTNIEKKGNVRANRDCLVHDTRDRHQNTRIGELESYVLPFLK